MADQSRAVIGRGNLDGTALRPNNPVLTDRSAEEDDTCAMCSTANMAHLHGQFIIARSDFKSTTLVTSRGKELGVKRDNALRTDNDGSDGILGTSARDKAEKNTERQD